MARVATLLGHSTGDLFAHELTLFIAYAMLQGL